MEALMSDTFLDLGRMEKLSEYSKVWDLASLDK